MFILLAIAAWSDNHGAEVSDTISVPYAVFGCYAAFLHERWVTACVCVVLLTAVLMGIRMPFWDNVNAFLMKRAYADEEWIIVDATAAEVGYPQYMTMSEHEKVYGYSHSLNTGINTQIKQALIETAESVRNK